MINFFTSESVTEGHPDKLCDYISDSILDECLKQDRSSRVAAEVLASKGEVYVTGEITSKAKIDIDEIVRNCIKNVGYGDERIDIDYKTCKININISRQSLDIALGVDKDGAGDQGIMFGYACDETEEYMPMPIYLAHKLARKLADVRKNNIIKNLRPDGKVQVTVEYDNFIPKRIDAIVVSSQHNECKPLDDIRNEIKSEVINKVIQKNLLDQNTRYYINPTGKFVIGGPLGDVGLTGRKIIVDTYGGFARHGGGAFSGKDPTKVDRSAAYMARFLAKNIVANGYAKRCELQLSYAIGIKQPISIFIETFGTEKIPKEEILEKIRHFDLTPKGIIEYLILKQPIYTKTTNYGHFGKKEMTWEKIIKL